MDVPLVEIPESSRGVAAQLGVPPDIHQADFIFKHLELLWKDFQKASSSYFISGQSSAEMLKTFIDDVVRVRNRLGQEWNPRTILDFASGYGCVARHLPKVFPGSDITACDIHPEAVHFNQQRLGINSILSSDTPELLDVGQHDLVFCLSFFSHMPRATFERWLQTLARAVRPGGVLLFTTHGHIAKAFGHLPIDVDGGGFGFMPASEQHDLKAQTYGTTISTAKFVLRCIERCEDLRLHHFREAIWWNIQDTYVCVRDG